MKKKKALTLGIFASVFVFAFVFVYSVIADFKHLKADWEEENE